MERSKAIFLLLAMMALATVASGLDDKAAVQPNATATASKVVAALEENLPEQNPATSGSQEHSKGRIVARKGAVMNVTVAATVSTTSTPIASTVPKATEAQHKNITTTTEPLGSVGQANNNTIAAGGSAANATALNNSTVAQSTTMSNATSATSSSVAVPSAPKPTTTQPSSTSTSTTSTTTTTTTTTKPPKKPKITYSVDDEPKLLQAAKPGYSAQSGAAAPTISDANGRLHVEEPLAELSKEYIPPGVSSAAAAGDTMFGGSRGGHREYVVPVVTLIFAIPLLAGLFLLSYRRAKEFWLTRHYRRMDFLVDGMYNY